MTNSVPVLLRNVRNLLTFSSSKENVQEQVRKVNRSSFFEDEKAKVKKIKTLLNNGKHDQALGELLEDFANEDGIQYFNKIRHVEGQNNSNDSPDTTVGSNGVSSHLIVV